MYNTNNLEKLFKIINVTKYLFCKFPKILDFLSQYINKVGFYQPLPHKT